MGSNLDDLEDRVSINEDNIGNLSDLSGRNLVVGISDSKDSLPTNETGKVGINVNNQDSGLIIKKSENDDSGKYYISSICQAVYTEEDGWDDSDELLETYTKAGVDNLLDKLPKQKSLKSIISIHETDDDWEKSMPSISEDGDFPPGTDAIVLIGDNIDREEDDLAEEPYDMYSIHLAHAYEDDSWDFDGKSYFDSDNFTTYTKEGVDKLLVNTFIDLGESQCLLTDAGFVEIIKNNKDKIIKAINNKKPLTMTYTYHTSQSWTWFINLIYVSYSSAGLNARFSALVSPSSQNNLYSYEIIIKIIENDINNVEVIEYENNNVYISPKYELKGDVKKPCQVLCKYWWANHLFELNNSAIKVQPYIFELPVSIKSKKIKRIEGEFDFINNTDHEITITPYLIPSTTFIQSLDTSYTKNYVEYSNTLDIRTHNDMIIETHNSSWASSCWPSVPEEGVDENEWYYTIYSMQPTKAPKDYSHIVFNFTNYGFNNIDFNEFKYIGIKGGSTTSMNTDELYKAPSTPTAIDAKYEAKFNILNFSFKIYYA